jgi:hypothetical protein
MSNSSANDSKNTEANPDPLTGEAGAHPVATGIGAAAAGAVGLAASAAIAGPIGVAVATAGGALVGGYVGKAVGEVLDPTAEEAFWREEHPKQTYAEKEVGFDDYLAAYQTGYEGYQHFGRAGRSFEEAEPDVRDLYLRTSARLPWPKARFAARAAWQRVHNARANKAEPARTGVGEAVLSENALSGSLSNAQTPR